MELKELLLTDEELNKAVEPAFAFIPPDEAFETMIMKAQCLKLIEWLEAGKFLLHQQWIGNSTASEWECFPNCWLCKLKKQLREGWE